jgi:hypothetical protein
MAALTAFFIPSEVFPTPTKGKPAFPMGCELSAPDYKRSAKIPRHKTGTKRHKKPPAQNALCSREVGALGRTQPVSFRNREGAGSPNSIVLITQSRSMIFPSRRIALATQVQKPWRLLRRAGMA